MPRKRKTNEELKKGGTYKEHKHGGRNPPLPDPVARCPSPPKWLNADQKVIFKRTAKNLMEVGLLTVLDTDLLANYSALQDCVSKDFGSATPAMHGQLSKMRNDLGLSAASRERLTVKKPSKEVNEFDEI